MKHAKKLLSLLLVFCMLLGMLPLGVLAAETDAQQEQARLFALYMTELGLVDETGQLIEDNTFTLADGTKLASLDALLDYLSSCEESDMDTLITVDATGKVATAELLIQALSIESQVGMLASALDLLSTESSSASSLSVSSTAVSPHDLHLVQKLSASGDVVTIQVGVSTSANGDFVAAPNDITIESGLFVNRIDYSYVSTDGNGVYVNNYGAATLTKGETCIEYKLNLAKVREYYNCQYASTTPWGDYGHVDGENGHWQGYETALFQSRIVDGAPEQSVQNYFRFVPFSGTSDVLKEVTGKYKAADVNNTSSNVPVVVSNFSTYTTTDGNSYFTFTPSDFKLIDDETGNGGYPMNTHFKGAWYLGAGDLDRSIIIDEAYAILKVNNTINPNSNYPYGGYNDGENFFPFNFALYRNNSGTLIKIANGTPLYLYSEDKPSLAKKIAAAVSGGWSFSESDTIMTNTLQLLLREALYDPSTNTIPLDQRRIGLYFSNLKIPNDEKNNALANPFPTLAFETNSLTIFEGFATNGKVSIADTTDPTVESVSIYTLDTTNPTTFRPGDVVPIVVEFTEPVKGDYTLQYEDSGTKTLSSASTSPVYGSVSTSSTELISNLRVFYYTVQPGDTGIKVTGVTSDNGTDAFENTFKPDSTTTMLSGKMRAVSVKDTISSLSATVDDKKPTEMTVTVTLKDNANVQTYWGNWNEAEASKKPFTLSVILNGDETKLYSDATLNGTTVTYTIPLPALETGTKDYTVELYISEGDFTGKYYGAYATCTQKAIVKANENAFTIRVNADGWPSGTDNVVYVQNDTLPVFSATAGTQKDHTFQELTQFYWVSSDPDVLDIKLNGTENDLQSSATITVTPKKEGTAILSLRSKNGGSVSESQASNAIEITVKDDNSPTLFLPASANTFYARKDTDLTFSFTSNLGEKYPDGDGIAVNLYKNGETTPIYTDTLARSATSLTIPKDYLTDISTGDTPSYHVTLSTTATYYGQSKNLSTDAYIVVRSQPVKISLPWTSAPLLTSDQTLAITWTLENWDTTNLSACGFDFRVEKNGEIVSGSHITDVGQAATASYTLVPTTPDGLKDEYVILIKAKNATDPTWSTASTIVTVYRSDALDLVVGGKKTDTLNLKNAVTQTATTTSPTITTYDGETISGLTTAQSIADLRGQLSLMESISINYDDYDWNYVNDMFRWSTTESEKNANITETAEKLQEIVSINYRQGGYYEPLENFSYLYYIPKALMLLCGLSDGTTTVTAQHARLSNLSSSVTVNVELLKNKLYLFQFTPAVQTTVSYEDGNGTTHTVTSNDDGSLALYEPDGIASDLRCASTVGGEIYRGTASMLGDSYNINLKSGEGNGVYGELYPLNAVELRPAASMELTIFKPDGTPLSNASVTLRGGVYRNLDQVTDAARRDTAYCSSAKFSKTSDGTASLDGTVDQTFTTDANGVLHVYMDSTQFVSQRDPDPALTQEDSFRFVFELRFANDAYQPEIVEFDTQLTQADVIRSGGNLLTLTAASAVKPVVASQTVDYYTGRELDVRRHTGVVGPSADYAAVRLSTRLLLWGMDAVSTTDTGYSFDVRAQETAVKLSGQTHLNARTASYPFSSIPLLENVTIIRTDSFGDFQATTRIPLELVLYNGSGAMERTLTLPFGLIDMTAVEKVSESDSVIGLMTKLTLSGSSTISGLNNNTVMNLADDLVSALSLLEGVGAKLGLIRTILMPTEDPTIFSAYVWTGYDTTTMADLRYDERGIYLEPAHLVQDLEQVSFAGFTIGDFKAMSDGTYSERLQEDNSAVASLLFGDGSVMQGWMTAEICYNFNEGRWEVITTGGGMRFGKQIELAIQKQRFQPIAYNYGVVLRGGLVVTLETAIRYAEQIGSGQGSAEMLQAINDYLTSIRVNAFIELYGGIGVDKWGVAFTFGAYGDVELNTESRYLSRGDENGKTKGDYIQLDGTVGLREKLGFGSMVLEFDLVSITVGNQWRLGKWDEINQSWAENQSGYSTGWLGGSTTSASTYSASSSDRQIVVATNGGEVRVQSRDYLQENGRSWLGGGGVATLALQSGTDNRLSAIQTNAYPFSMPMLTDDGGLLVYLSDADSTDVEDVEVRFSQNSGGTFPDGTAISGPDDFSGYGDSDLDLDGNMNHAAATWLRQSAHLDLSPGAKVTEAEQLVLTGGLEVVASIWNGTGWSTTRLTNNATQELTPVIAINSAGSKAVAAWRSVQRGDSLLTFTENRVLFKLYNNGTWSDQTYTLYNGSSGNVSSMSIEMIGDTALIAYTLEDSDDAAKDTEIYYALVDTTATDVEAAVKTVRVTTNDYTDADPQLTTAGDCFVLGWYRESDDQGDIGLLTIDKNGAPRSDLPASLSDIVSTESFNGKFAFVKGAGSLDALSLLWIDSKTGDTDNDGTADNNDIIRAIKFSNFGTASDPNYGASAAIEVAALPQNTRLTSIDAYTDGGTDVQAVLQATTYTTVDKNDHSTYDTVTVIINDATGETRDALVPKETVHLYSAYEEYSNKLSVIGTNVDYTTLATNSCVPVTFTVSNQGMHAIRNINVNLGGTTQTFSSLTLLPGQSTVLSVVVKTGDTIADLPYTLTATFTDSSANIATGTLYLDYPDVGISTLNVTREQDGHRTFLATLYNQSAASLNKSGRRVVLSVYTDPTCTTHLDGKYFKGGTAGSDYEIIISSPDNLRQIDSAGYAQELDFDIAAYIKDAGLTEIPDSGVTLFVKARVEQFKDSKWVEMPEADTQNNQKSITFRTLLERSGSANVTTSVELTNTTGASTANVQLRSHTLQPSNSNGYLLAALLDSSGSLLETQNIGDVSLQTEEIRNISVSFSQSGSRVVLRYGEPVTGTSTSNANVASITLDGLPLTLDSFDQDGTAELFDVPGGSYLLTVLPESAGATVAVNGRLAENGMASLSSGGSYTITVTSADGSATSTYTIYLHAASTGSVWYTLRFETNGGSALSSFSKASGTTVDLAAYRPTRAGYTFAGWYADPELTQPLTKVQLTRDMTLYAAWVEGDPENPFTDVNENDWFYSDVLYAYKSGLMNGTGETTFSPHRSITRGMIVAILYRLEESPSVSGSCPFTDVKSGAYYERAILWAAENGIVTGYGNGTFAPDAPITREQLAAILYRYAQYKQLDVSVGEDTNILSCDDALDISNYAFPAMQWAVGSGLMQGSGNRLSPASSATRAQAAAILKRYIENLAK